MVRWGRSALCRNLRVGDVPSHLFKLQCDRLKAHAHDTSKIRLLISVSCHCYKDSQCLAESAVPGMLREGPSARVTTAQPPWDEVSGPDRKGVQVCAAGKGHHLRGGWRTWRLVSPTANEEAPGGTRRPPLIGRKGKNPGVGLGVNTAGEGPSRMPASSQESSGGPRATTGPYKR